MLLKLTSLIPGILTILYVFYPRQFSKVSLESVSGGFGSTHRTLEICAFFYSINTPPTAFLRLGVGVG